jgi:hypothetical protein
VVDEFGFFDAKLVDAVAGESGERVAKVWGSSIGLWG